jgi:hypothetical protein
MSESTEPTAPIGRRTFVKAAAGGLAATGLSGLAGAGLNPADATGAPGHRDRGACRHDAWPEHGIYDATIVYGIDEQVETPFYPMDEDRNTVEYRTGAYDFFRERYGMDFDPEIEGDQVISDGAGGQAVVQAVKTGLGSTHQVYAIDAQRIPRWRGRFPLTSVAFLDDGYFVAAITDFTARGTYGGEDGLRIRAGDLVVQGEYRMFDGQGDLMDVITYFADTPATNNPFNGDLEASNGAQFVNITCRVESPILGTGLTRGIGEMRPLDDGNMDLDFRYVMHFPARLPEGTIGVPRCDSIRAL